MISAEATGRDKTDDHKHTSAVGDPTHSDALKRTTPPPQHLWLLTSHPENSDLSPGAPDRPGLLSERGSDSIGRVLSSALVGILTHASAHMPSGRCAATQATSL